MSKRFLENAADARWELQVARIDKAREEYWVERNRPWYKRLFG
jgi:hypothetical protein